MVRVDVGSDQKLYMLTIALLLLLMLLTSIYRTVVDIGPGVTHRNHEDTITTPLPGNCPNCNYPDCGGCDGKPQLTLEPTVIIPTIPPFGGTPDPATPDIPDPTQYPTIFPTFGVEHLLPTPIPTMVLPTIAPTLIAPAFPPSPIPVGN